MEPTSDAGEPLPWSDNQRKRLPDLGSLFLLPLMRQVEISIPNL